MYHVKGIPLHFLKKSILNLPFNHVLIKLSLNLLNYRNMFGWVLHKFLAKSFFCHLVLKKKLGGSFSNTNMHGHHLDFNGFLAGSFFGHLVFLWWLNSCQSCFIYAVVHEKSNDLKVLYTKGCSGKFHGW